MDTHLTSDNKLKKIIIVGDRVLVKPVKPDEKSRGGLYLPPGVREQEKAQKGYVIKTGPGFVVPVPGGAEESWKPVEEQIKYIPLQAKEGDVALFLRSAATEIRYEGEIYYIVPYQAILMLEREEEL